VNSRQLIINKEGYLFSEPDGQLIFCHHRTKEGIKLNFSQIIAFKTLSTETNEKGELFKEVNLIFTIQENLLPEIIKPEDYRPWPFNGYVINNSSSSVTVWSGEKGIYEIPSNSTSGQFTEDVDHIQDQTGQWYKIGPNRVTVLSDGTITGYECKTSSYNTPCGQ